MSLLYLWNIPMEQSVAINNKKLIIKGYRIWFCKVFLTCLLLPSTLSPHLAPSPPYLMFLAFPGKIHNR